MELTKGELFLITVLRNYDFLRKLNYSSSQFNIIGKEYWVIYENKRAKRRIEIINSEPDELQVYIVNTKKFSKNNRRSLLAFYKIKPKSLTINDSSYFIKEKLYDIINGRSW